MSKKYKNYDADEILNAAKAFRERVKRVEGELKSVHAWRACAERWLDSLEKRVAKLESENNLHFLVDKNIWMS